MRVRFPSPAHKLLAHRGLSSFCSASCCPLPPTGLQWRLLRCFPAGTFSIEERALAVALEAERHAAEVAGGAAGGLDPATRATRTIAEYAPLFLRHHQVEENTKDTLRLHVIPFLGGCRLAETDRTVARNYITALQEGGRSANTIRQAKVVLGAMFGMAWRMGTWITTRSISARRSGWSLMISISGRGSWRWLVRWSRCPASIIRRARRSWCGTTRRTGRRVGSSSTGLWSSSCGDTWRNTRSARRR